MNEGRVANERRAVILQAVDTFIKIHDAWEADMKGPTQPTERFEKAVKVCTEICDHGDTPQDCRRLITAVAKMGVEWIKYENGVNISDAHGEVRPTKQFWEAVRGVKLERAGAAPFQPRKRESVKMLLEQKVSPEQIARFIYADAEWENGYGPLLGSRGEVNYEAVEQEAREAGSVIPKDWIHPDDRGRLKADEDRLRTSLAELQAESQKVEIKEDPVAMLREGQYANVVARECGLTLDQVMEIANQEGIKAEKTPNLAAMRAPQEPEINPEAAAAMDARVIDEGSDEPSVETAEQQVIRLAGQGLTKHAIAAELGMAFKDVKAILTATETGVR